jgi:hypothetical protein
VIYGWRVSCPPRGRDRWSRRQRGLGQLLAEVHRKMRHETVAITSEHSEDIEDHFAPSFRHVTDLLVIAKELHSILPEFDA